MVNLLRGVLILFVTGTTASCAGLSNDDGTEMVSYKTLLSRNLANLSKLTVGMTKPQIMQAMGNFAAKTRDSYVPNPYKTESFIVGKTQYEALYYMTQTYPPFTPIKLSQASPVVLREGQVIGWSVNASQNANAGKRELSQEDKAWIVQECQTRYTESDMNSLCLLKITEALFKVYAGQSTQRDSATRRSAPTAPGVGGTPVYQADECTGPVINGRCHGSIIPKSAVPKRCYGTMLNGQCTGPMF